MSNKMVSVIMPIYNEERSLPKSIESVLNQTLTNFELILIDDCSTDCSLSILKKYSKNDCRIKIVQNATNSRLSPVQWEPRNDGLKHATGEFIAYLDGDNTWDAVFLESLIGVFKQQPEMVIAFCDSKNYYSKSDAYTVLQGDLRNLKDHGEDWTIYSIDTLEIEKLGDTQYIDTNEMMHRASVFNDLTHLWSTFHPKREIINKKQALVRPYRRHNDLDLAERIINKYGLHRCYHLQRTLVHYYYDSYYQV